MKQVHQDIIDARAEGKPRVNLFQFHFSQGTLNISDSPFDMTAEGVTYSSSGLVLKVGEIASKTSLINVNKSITLSGADQSLIAVILGETQVNREFIQRVAYLNDDWTLIQTPYLEWQGVMTSMTSDGNPLRPKITVATSTIFDDFDRRVNRTTSVASQQSHFPLDTGMRYASETKEEIKWGTK